MVSAVSTYAAQYPVRVSQCDKARDKVKKRHPDVDSLRDASPEQVSSFCDSLLRLSVLLLLMQTVVALIPSLSTTSVYLRRLRQQRIIRWLRRDAFLVRPGIPLSVFFHS